jgi:hypothetical protein
MRAPDPGWAGFLLSIAKGQAQNIQDWRELHRRFGVTVTKDVQTTQSFFCFGLQPDDPFPLDRQWIYAINKLANQINHDLQDWRSPKARILGVVSAFTQLIKPLSNCPGLSESQQIDFIERIDRPDLPPNDIHILKGDPFILLRIIDTCSGLAKGRRFQAVQMRNRTVVLQFDDDETRALTRIPWESNQMG